jgi:DNA polymerase-4
MAKMLIFHMDMDAFFASIEQRDHPEYQGKPVIVGGRSNRGVVATCSYEARVFGVHSAQPMSVALRKCPQAIIATPRMSVYSEVSKQIMGIMGDFSPNIEPLSVDEAFMDMAGLLESPMETALEIQRRVFEETQLTCSVGIGPNKFLAKFATDLQKPNGVTIVPEGLEAEFRSGFPVRKLWGVGPKTEERLTAIGMELIGDIAAADLAWLRIELGRGLADHLRDLSLGVDLRVIKPDRTRRSIGSENTFEVDLRSRAEVERHLVPHADDVAQTLRKKKLRAGGVRVKIRYTDGFQLQSRQITLEHPSDDARVLLASIFPLLDGLDLTRAIRLVGLSTYDLVEDDQPEQLGLFQPQARPSIGKAVDAIANRFGPNAIQRGSRLSPPDRNDSNS